MSPEGLRLLVKRRPFKPFRITMSTSESFDVWHPDLMIVGRSIAALGLGKAGEEPIAEGIIWLDLDQIVHVQPVSGSGASASSQ
jgi:hypothetical protein